MEANVDLSKDTDDELLAEIEGMKLALGTSLAHPFLRREEQKNPGLLAQIEAIKIELDRRHAHRT
jgi:hypothetical protein